MVANLIVNHCHACLEGFGVRSEDLDIFKLPGMRCRLCGTRTSVYLINFIGGAPKGYLEGIGFYMCNLVEEDLGMLLPG